MVLSIEPPPPPVSRALSTPPPPSENLTAPGGHARGHSVVAPQKGSYTEGTGEHVGLAAYSIGPLSNNGAADSPATAAAQAHGAVWGSHGFQRSGVDPPLCSSRPRPPSHGLHRHISAHYLVHYPDVPFPADGVVAGAVVWDLSP